MKLLSVSMPGHDVNMSFHDGRVVRYLKLERRKQEKRFHFHALLDWKREAESIWDLDIDAIDDIVFSFDPGALPAALKGELGPQVLNRLARDASKAERLSPRLCAYLGVRQGWFASHHYSHALSTWMLETQTPALQIVIDGLGDGRPWSVYKAGRLIAAGDIRNGSIGWGIREAGKLLDITYGHYNDIAGKVMGLQAYGRLDQGYFDYLDRFTFLQIKELWSVSHWYAYKGDALVGKLSHLDWIATVHAKMGAMLVDFFKQFADAGDTISYSGGVAQNVVWNSMFRQVFPKLVIAPHASDEGLSLGALEWLRQEHGQAPLSMPAFPWAQSDCAVAAPTDATIQRAAKLLAEGKIVGWYQGFGEIGPRALGNRSILMDPRLQQGKERINTVKHREQYRPFGASVLKEHFSDYFDGFADDFMLYTCQLRSGTFPAITHVDGSCRVQLVGDGNPAYRQLLAAFHTLTGCPILLNTSLNLAGKPIAAFPEQAIELFYDSKIDVMVVGDAFYQR
ncbi:carbamoyltransferase C-terminal domain-containing protein [Massilia sp. TWP1-3-3]|uniref:carbamoyltransferase C-terminal domain-containing protein n=1 Tax=Massilia sp. TWP1-3-3 TaxID=2804573 RepID=UPI003CEF0880